MWLYYQFLVDPCDTFSNDNFLYQGCFIRAGTITLFPNASEVVMQDVGTMVKADTQQTTKKPEICA